MWSSFNLTVTSNNVKANAYTQKIFAMNGHISSSLLYLNNVQFIPGLLYSSKKEEIIKFKAYVGEFAIKLCKEQSEKVEFGNQG